MLVDLDLRTGSRLIGEAVTGRHFGGNYLFNRVSFTEQMGEDGGFDEVAADLGIGHLRYPGGTIAEQQFSLLDPDNDFQAINLATGGVLNNAAQHRLQPMTEFLAAAHAAGAKVTIVLPTAQYEGDPIRARWEAQAFVTHLMNGPYAHVVEAFELGNEWATFFGSAGAYGQIADAMTIGLKYGLQGTGHDPMIAIQPSAKAARLHETREIIEALSTESLDAIDAVILHDYRTTPWEERTTSASKISHASLFNAATGRDLDIIASEWNIGNRSANDGLLQGAGMLDMFRTHLVNGVDMSHVWPLLENNTTRLAGNVDAQNPDGGADLMIGGAVFQMMSESLEGTRLLNFFPSYDTDLDGSADLLIYGYEAQDKLVVFVASLEAHATNVALRLDDLADIDAAFQHLWVTEVAVADGVDPTSHKALPVVSQYAGAVSSDVSLSLEAFQITRLEFSNHGGSTISETAGLDDLRGTHLSEVFVLADDGQRDLVRSFNDATDRLDVSAFGARSLDDLTITELKRKDGSTSWIQIEDSENTAEVILRFEDGHQSAAKLQEDNFIFAGEDDMSPVPGMESVVDTGGFDSHRGTQAVEVFVMADDGERDLIRDFEDGVDLIDVSRIATEYGELTIRNLQRKDGSVSWVEILDANGEPEMILRFSGGAHDADRLSAEDFIF